VAVLNDAVVAVVDGKLMTLGGGALTEIPGAPSGVRRVRALGGALWAAAETGTYRFSEATWARVADVPFVDFCLHLGRCMA